MKALFKNRVFLITMITDLIQHTSIWIRNIALLFFVMDITNNNPIAVSLLIVTEYLPIFLFSFVGGALADRLNPKRIMLVGDILSGISVVVIMILVSAGVWQAVFLATLVSAIVTQLSLPSSLVMFKKFLPEEAVSSAMAISQTTSSLYTIVGPIIGTAIFTALGIKVSLSVIAALFFCSCFAELALPTYKRDDILTNTSFAKQIKEGFVYVKKSANLMVIALICLTMGIGQGIINPLTAYVVIERLGMKIENIQWLYSVSGVGLLLGGIVAAVIYQKINVKKMTFIGLCVFAIGTVLEVLSVWLAFTVGIKLFVGVIIAIVQVVINSLLLKLVSQEYVGRVNGIIVPIMTGAVLIGSSVSGIMMKNLKLIPTYMVAAVIIFIGAFISLRLKIDKQADASAPFTY